MALKQIKLKYLFCIFLYINNIYCQGQVSLDNQQVHSSTESPKSNKNNISLADANTTTASITISLETTTVTTTTTSKSTEGNTGQGSKDTSHNVNHERLLQNTPGIYCTCDLHPFICDINCCCDSKCISSDRQLFSHCTPTGDATFLHSPKSCYSKHLFAYSSHLTTPTEKESSGVRSTLLCVEWSNVKKKNYYPDRKVLTNANEVAKLNTGHKYTWNEADEGTISEPLDESQLYLKDGDALRLITPNLPGWQMWTLPSSIFSPSGNGLCDSNQPTRYLRSSITSCLRYIRSPESDCSSFLSQSTYTNHLIDRRLPAFASTAYASSGDSPQVQVLTSSSSSSSSQATSESNKNAIKPKSSTHTASLFSSSTCIKDETCIPLSAKDELAHPTHFTMVNDSNNPNSKPKATCLNAVRKVKYEVFYTTETKFGPIIEKINVSFDRIDLYGSKGFFRQFFDVTFTKLSIGNESSNETTFFRDEGKQVKSNFKFSGNPGYQMKRPILAIKMIHPIGEETNESTSSLASLNEDPSLIYGNILLPVLAGLSDNSCPSPSNSLYAKVKTVLFGVNVRTSCLLNLSTVKNQFYTYKATSYFSFLPKLETRDDESAICHRIQRIILESLDTAGKVLNSTHVGIFGNSNISHVSDWLPIINVNPSASASSMEPLAIEIPSLTPSNTCPLLITGLSYEIYYSMVGPVDQPQAKIISFVRKFTTSSNIQPFASNSKSTASFIAITATATFYDLTRGVRSKFAPPPVLKIQLPADFFYPFLLMHSSSTQNNPSLLMKIITLCCVVIWMKFK